MTSVIFLATLTKTLLLKSSSMLLINFFTAASTLQCCYARVSSFFFFSLTENADMGALPYFALESKQGAGALDVLSAFILRLKKSKELFRSLLQNY